jgi:hypothetical protein
MRLTKQNVLHWAIAGAFLTGLGVSFDAWWHVSKGRDTFFALPHLVLHLGVLIMLIASLRAWQEFKLKEWKKIFLTFFVIPLSLPFDELWHYYRGKESIDSILIVWSPPHLALFLAAIIGMFMLSRLLHRERDMAAKEIFGAALLAAMSVIAFVIVGPFFPFSPFAVLGHYGAAVTTFVMAMIMFYARKILPHTFPAFLTAIISVTFLAIVADSVAVYGSRAAGHIAFIPSWVVALSQMALALVIDSRATKNNIILGGLGGLALGFLLYGLSLGYIDPVFRYTGTAIAIRILSAGFGGAAAGWFFRK